MVTSLFPFLTIFLSLSKTHTNTHKQGEIALFGQQAASKLRCAHGRAGTWKTKANMQAHIRLEHITGFTQPSFSCSEKANVEWNSLMCTAHPKNVKPDVDAPKNINQNYTMMNKEECNMYTSCFTQGKTPKQMSSPCFHLSWVRSLWETVWSPPALCWLRAARQIQQRFVVSLC